MRAIVRRILARLADAERREVDPWVRDDLRIAWITVLNAARGDTIPHIAATYTVLGLHPDRVWSAIVERRKALLGSCYETWWGSLPPKKPVQSVAEGSKKQPARDSRSRAG